MSEPPIDKLLRSLSEVRPSGGGFKARCPAHDDANPSLSVKQGDDGRVLLHCFAGCTTESIVHAMKVPMADLFPTPQGTRRNRHRNGRAEHRRWELRDADGRLIAVHHRKDGPDGKRVWWRGPNGERRLKDAGLAPADLPLYGAEKARSWADDVPVVVVEGEKAADALRATYEPVLATVTGASETPGCGALKILRGRRVVLWPDADEPGRGHMERLAAALQDIVPEVRVYRWPDPPKDVKGPDAADHPAVVSGDPEAVEGLLEELRAAPAWEPGSFVGTSGEECAGLEGRVRLAGLIRGGIEPTPQLVDGLLYEGRIASVAGEPGTGKTLLALYLALGTIRRGLSVLYLDAENGPRLMAERLRDLGADLDSLDERFAYYQAHLTLDPADTARLAATVAEVRPALVVLDSFADFIAAAGLEENSNTDCTRWVSRVVQPLREAGIAVLILDHVPKGAKGPRGAGAKVAKVDVQWNLEVAQQFDRDKTGELTLKLSKDREGWLPKTTTFSVGGGVFAPSSGTIEAPGADSLTEKQREVLDFLKGRGGEGATWRELEAEIGSKGTLSRALKELAQRNLFTKRGNRYYLPKAEPEKNASKPDSGGSVEFHPGSTEPTEPGKPGEVPQVPPPFRGGTVEPDASNLDEDRDARRRRVREAFDAPGSGPAKILATYLAGETRSEYVIRAVLRFLGEHTDGWGAWAEDVMAVAGERAEGVRAVG